MLAPHEVPASFAIRYLRVNNKEEKIYVREVEHKFSGTTLGANAAL